MAGFLESINYTAWMWLIYPIKVSVYVNTSEIRG
jgi:hypothetical protein